MLTWPGILEGIVTANISAAVFAIDATIGNLGRVVIENVVLNKDEFFASPARWVSPRAVTNLTSGTAPGWHQNVHGKYIAS